MGMKKTKLGRPPGGRSQDTRARILLAAQDCFGKYGFSGATNAEIAAAAGVTTGNLYNYYDSKLDLYVATVEDAQRRLLPHYLAAAEKVDTAREKIASMYRTSAHMFEVDPSITTFLAAVPIEMGRNEAVSSALKERSHELLGQFRNFSDFGLEQGAFQSGQDPEHLMIMFLGSMMGLGLFCLALGDKDMGDVVKPFVDLMEGRVFA